MATAMAVGSIVAAPTASIATGATTVTADAEFLAAAKSLNVTVAPITGTKLIFKILAGNIDLANANGEILHGGGLVLKSATTKVELRNFIIDTTGDAPVLTGLVVANEVTVGRLPLFNLNLPLGFEASLPLKAKGTTKSLTLSSIDMKLSDGAAKALNGAFKVSAFKAGLQIGMAKVQAFGLMNK